MVNAKNLMKILEANPDAEVILASDEEGSSFGRIDERGIDVRKERIILYPWGEMSIS